jgi:hypothetical protein
MLLGTSLSVIGYLSYVPDIRQVLIKSPNIPLRNELLAMDPQVVQNFSKLHLFAA